MNLQYITNNQGVPTGVYIPINDWNILRDRYKNIEKDFLQIPDWHKEIVNKRINDFEKNNTELLDFNKVMEQIENEL